MLNDISRVIYTKEQLDDAISRLAKQISIDYKDKNLLLVCILKGSIMVLTDLMRALTVPCSVEFMVVSSYGAEMYTAGRVKIIKDLDIDVKNYDLLIVEDIFDSGVTLSSLSETIKNMKNPRSFKICTLIDRPSGRRSDITLKPDYVGLTLEDDGFIVGYGLDFNEHYRNLPFIGVLTKEAIEKVKKQ